MPNVPGTPNIPGGGERQKRAAKLKAEMERRTAEVAKPQESQPEEPSQETQVEEQQDTSTGPVGDGDYVVKEGDCTSSIAKNTGHFWETVWNDPANSRLKELRKDPNVLLPGDRLTVPELRPKEEPGATEQRHRFRRKGEPSLLRLRILEPPWEEDEDEDWDEDESVEDTEGGTSDQREVAATAGNEEQPPQEDVPRAKVPYTLIIDGESFDGVTDENGVIERPIPGNAKRGRLILEPGTPDETEIRLRLGALSPMSEWVGVKERLANLGFDCGERREEMTEELEGVLTAFQEKHALTATGKLDSTTQSKILELHGS